MSADILDPSAYRFLPLPDLSRKIEGDSVRRVLMSLFMSLYTAFIENILVLFGVVISNKHCISSRFFEIQPKEISSQVSEKASKGRFLYDKPEKLQTHSNEEIGKEKKKERVFIIVPLSGARPAFRL